MTVWIRFGMERKNKLKDTKGDMLDIDTGFEKWKAQQVNGESNPIIDPGIGKAYVMRSFVFSFKANTLKAIQEKRIPAPTRQELFNSVWPQIKVTLWGDGLIAVQDEQIPPRMEIKKTSFIVIIICEARTKLSGIKETLLSNPKTLNQYLAMGKKRSG